MTEIWKAHPLHSDYEASDFGRIRRRTAKSGTRAGRIKKAYVNDGGYEVVSIGKKKYKVHVFVLETFVGPRPVKHDGCHNDGVRRNNMLSNLRWATRKENMADAAVHGTAQINAEKIRAYWRNPENRRKQSERVLQFNTDHPDVAAQRSIKARKALATPEVRRRMSLGKRRVRGSILERVV